jgi:uncharacterized protein YegL
MAESKQPIRPGGEVARREMHFFWLLDGSSSMGSENGQKIAALNYAVANAIPGMRDAAKKATAAKLLVRALRFADDVEWLIEQPTPLSDLTWTHEVRAKGETAMAKAINAVVDKLDEIDVNQRFFPPAIILVTDGHPTDGEASFQSALKRLMTHRVGSVSQRFAVAIGADADRDLLKEFIGEDTIPVLEANDADSLEAIIKLVSASAIASGTQLSPKNDIAEVLRAQQKSKNSIDEW